MPGAIPERRWSRPIAPIFRPSMSTGLFPNGLGGRPAPRLRGSAIDYCGKLYRRFDAVYALSENGGAAKLRSLGVPEVDVVPLGRRAWPILAGTSAIARLRRRLGISDDQPLLIYAGRLDQRKAAACRGRGVPPAAAHRSARTCCCSATGRCANSSRARRSRAHLRPRLLPRPERSGGVAGQRRSLCLRHGRRDVRHFDHRGQASGLPVVGVAAGAMVDRVPTASAWLAKSTMPT